MAYQRQGVCDFIRVGTRHPAISPVRVAGRDSAARNRVCAFTNCG